MTDATNGTIFGRLKAAAPTLTAGIISADLMKLASEIEWLEKSGVGALHFDVMDGHFTPDLTIGPSFIKKITSSLIKDVHLLTDNPEERLADYVKAGAEVLTVHIERLKDPLGTMQALERLNNGRDLADRLVRGVAINPATPLSALEPVLDDLEMITVLAVDACHGEHPSMEAVEIRIAKVKKMISHRRDQVILCIDGGVKRDNIERFAAMGADLLVSGSALFAGENPMENVKYMLGVMQKG
ncbi:MAG: ribulose-phosphate 3-epimerase [Magnetococcales bacterium]|nr:ribulose-phosphate 3-epimerase [Magnetococcales bacterium]